MEIGHDGFRFSRISGAIDRSATYLLDPRIGDRYCSAPNDRD
jgi:hypothetical protein